MQQLNKKTISPLFFTVGSDSYLFDATSNLLMQIPPDEVDILKLIFQETDNLKSLIELFTTYGSTNNSGFYYILKNLSLYYDAFSKQQLEHDLSKADLFEAILQNGLHEMILELTSDCNFRCTYCIWSGQYENFRTHSNDYMRYEIAKKSIELYFSLIKEGELYNPKRRPAIAFYGGEPLLNYSVLKKTVNHIKENYAKKYDPQLTITTNGSLLNKEIIDFLLLNNFSIFVSLDGPKEEHNRKRLFQNGKGSYNLVISNINKVIKRGKELGLERNDIKIFALSVYDLKTSFDSLKKYFDEESPIPVIFINKVRPYQTDYYSQFTEEDETEFNNNLQKSYDQFLAYLERADYIDNVSNFFEAVWGFGAMVGKYRSIFSTSMPIVPYVKTCLPGFKLFVDVEGIIHPCERTPTSIVIGDVNNGLNISSIREFLLNFKKKVLNDCQGCAIAFSCSHCIATLNFNDNFSSCQNMKKSLVGSLSSSIRVSNTAPKYFDVRIKHNLPSFSYIDFK